MLKINLLKKATSRILAAALIVAMVLTIMPTAVLADELFESPECGYTLEQCTFEVRNYDSAPEQCTDEPSEESSVGIMPPSAPVEKAGIIAEITPLSGDVVYVPQNLTLAQAINTAPQDGSMRTIVITEDIVMAGAQTIANNRHITLIPGGNDITLYRTDNAGRHFAVTDATLVIDACLGGSTITLTRADPNSTTNSGGIGLTRSTLILNAGTISNNRLATGAGVNVTADSTFIMNGGTISGNIAPTSGGGVNVDGGSSFTMIAGTISGNTATRVGGGVNINLGSFAMSGGTISGNESLGTSGTDGGGGVRINNAASTFTMTNGYIIDNIVYRYGGGVFVAAGNFTLNGGTISGNYITGARNGGGVRVGANATFTMNAGTVSHNSARFGGGICVTGGNFILNNGTISHNEARDEGGGINIQGVTGTFTMNGGIISHNEARNHGGAVRVNGGGTAILDAGTISYNTANGRGGGVRTSSTSTNRVYVQGTVIIRDNDAVNTGGGIEVGGGIFTMTGGTVRNNTATNAGGGLNIETPHGVYILGGIIENNHAVSRGGGIRFSGGTATVVNLGGNAVIRSNTTPGAGGGIFTGSTFLGTLNISDNAQIYGNVAGHGGGVYIRGGGFNLHGGAIYNNTARANGGGVVVSISGSVGSGFTMLGGEIHNNTAGAFGGGVHVQRPNDVFTMTGGTIRNNTAQNGGGVSMRNGEIRIENGTILNNIANNNGGGVWLFQSGNEFSMYGGNILGNNAGGDGGGIFAEHTRTDNPLTEPANVYPQIRHIASGVTFSGNIAGNGTFGPPVNFNQVTHFDGLLLTNFDINYGHPNWIVRFILHGGDVYGNNGPIVELIESSGTQAERTLGDERVPTPVKDGYEFVGWRHIDSEPSRPEHWDGVFEIWNNARVAAYRVEFSTAFEALWEAVEGYDNGCDDNGYDDNGYDDNGYDDNGYDDNGYDDNGYDDDDEDDEDTPGGMTTTPPSNPGGSTGGGGGFFQLAPNFELDDILIPLIPFASTHYRYLIGDNYGRIRPRNNITRAEVATIFFRLITDEYREQMWTQENPFSDVHLQNWFNNGVSTMANVELLRGMPDGSFQPNRGITRAEFAAIISRFVDRTYDGELRFTDIEGHWAQDYINLVGSFGWVIGMPSGEFEPNRAITRAEAATIVNRILTRHPETVDDLLEDRRSWSDMTNQDAWYYLDLQEATNSHTHDIKDDDFHEMWIEIIPCPDWVALERPDSTPMAHRN